ncbi:MAG: radical SAM protein [bacterium]|nr:radical SAM protein [bacterium]
MTADKGKITLISVDQYGPALGVRFLSSVLRLDGYETTLIFAQGFMYQEIATGEAQAFPDDIHDEIARLSEGSLYVGISVLTPTFHKAREITQQLKRRMHDMLVIWGGVHVLAKPDECLRIADMLCCSEGEQVVTALAERLRNHHPYDDIPGVIIAGQAQNAEVIPVDIEHLPAPDYSLDGSHYLIALDRKRGFTISSFTLETYNAVMGFDYYLAPTRGCPYQCTYCINAKYAELYKGARRFRKRSLTSVMNELHWVKAHLPTVRRVVIDDDCFMALREDEIRAFTQEYAKDIGLPYVIRGAHPQNITEEKLSLLCEAGLMKLRVGIQTGSDRIRELYERTWESNEKILRMAEIIRKFIKQRRLKYIMYDIIVDVPWETEEDRAKTLDVVLSLPRPFGLYCFALTFYPGVKLYERAVAEGLIHGDSLDEAYWKEYWELAPLPENQIFEIMKYLPLPSGILRLLAETDKSSLSRYLAATFRGWLHALTQYVPETGLFCRTQLRYEADFQCLYDVATFDTYRKNILLCLQGRSPRMLIMLRKFLGTLYIQWWAPGEIFSAGFPRNHVDKTREEQKSIEANAQEVSLTLKLSLHP